MLLVENASAVYAAAKYFSWPVAYLEQTHQFTFFDTFTA